MSPWTGIIDKAFTRAEIVPYIKSLQFTNWQGQFVVLHNTQAPTLAQWHENAPAIPGSSSAIHVPLNHQDIVPVWSRC